MLKRPNGCGALFDSSMVFVGLPHLVGKWRESVTTSPLLISDVSKFTKKKSYYVGKMMVNKKFELKDFFFFCKFKSKGTKGLKMSSWFK